MPEPKPPENFGDMLKALSQSLREDAAAAFSMSEKELDQFLLDEGLDPSKTIAKVQKLATSLRPEQKPQPVSSGIATTKKLFQGHRRRFWTHPSVLKLGTDDPIEYIINRASKVVLDALQSGWQGPPFDPAGLAALCGVKLTPRADVADARIVPLKEREFQIEFNPAKSSSRIRFSLAHELAHKLFPDCAEAIRNRLSRHEQKDDDWQLELLCNLAAAEFLMPIGHFPQLKAMELSIRKMLELRKLYEVSTESILHRFVRLTEIPCAVFAASQRKEAGYRLEYLVSSRGWPISIPSGFQLPKNTRLSECSAIGYTAIGEEEWIRELGPVEVQCVRISPYPGESVPRFVGFIRSNKFANSQLGKITLVKGDVTEPRGGGVQILAHVVNDKTPNWGAGFGRIVQRKWPEVQNAFKSWTLKNPNEFSLGHIFYSETLEKEIIVLQMICQHGYGPSPIPRLRYTHLKSCLERLAEFACERKATIHMPKIGTGQAGGSWLLIEQMLDELLCSRGLSVTIYELPNEQQSTKPFKQSLFD